MTCKQGDIVIVKFPFIAKGSEVQKGRPALLISNTDIRRRYDDYTLAAISSQIPDEIMPLEIMLEPTKSNNLVKKSLLRLDFTMTIPVELVSRKIGTILPEQLKEAKAKLKLLFSL